MIAGRRANDRRARGRHHDDMNSASASARYVLLASTTPASRVPAAPKRRFRLARMQISSAGPPTAGGPQLRRAYD